jgi:HEAT repeat protein
MAQVRVSDRRGRGEATCAFCRETVTAPRFEARCGGCSIVVHRNCRYDLRGCPTIGCEGTWEVEGELELKYRPRRVPRWILLMPLLVLALPLVPASMYEFAPTLEQRSDELVQDLLSTDPARRQYAMDELVAAGDEGVPLALAGAQVDDPLDHHEARLAALQLIGPRGIEGLRSAAAEGPPGEQLVAAMALGSFGDAARGAIPELTGIVRSAPPAVSAAAVKALAALGGAEVMDGIQLGLIHTDEGVRQTAARSLPRVTRHLHQIQAGWTAALTEGARGEALSALRRSEIMPAGSEEGLRWVVVQDPVLAPMACEILLRAEGPLEGATLVHALRIDMDPSAAWQLRDWARKTLQQPGRAEALVGVVRADPVRLTAREAMHVADKYGAQDVVAPVLANALATPGPNATWQLGALLRYAAGHDELIPVVQPYLQDRAQRRGAVGVLTAVGTPAAVAALADLLAVTSDGVLAEAGLRSMAAQGLLTVGSPEALAALLVHAEDPQPSVQALGIRAAGRLNQLDLLARLSSSADPEVRLAVVNALDAVSDRDLREQAKDLSGPMRQDPDPRVARAAASAHRRLTR